MILRIKGIKRVKARGHTYYYHRASGQRIHAEPRSPEFAVEVARLDALMKARTAALEGTWGWLVEQYRKSPEWSSLAERTRSDYQKVLDYLKEPEPGKAGMTNVPLAAVTGPKLLDLRDAAAEKRGRRMANYVLAVISLVWNWGRPRGLCGPNPADGVPKVRRPKDARDVNRPWADNELASVLDAAPPHLKTAIALGAYTGLREGDVLRLPKSAYDSQVIEWRHAKTGELVWIPAHKTLRAILAEHMAKDATIIVTNSRGAAFTESGFRASFFKLIRKLETAKKVQPGLTFHGLRHTVATKLADAGADDRTIMAVTGHRTAAMVRRYTEQADRRSRATAAVAMLERAPNKNGKHGGKQGKRG